ncbi:MAG: gephyrin-like molybdotransferase Glp [Tumebacillaceae bacterium]
MRSFLSLEEAWAEMLEGVRPLGAEEVPLIEAYGRVLATEIRTRAPIPPFDRSALDGYAVRAVDLIDAAPNSPVTLEILEEVGAGRVPQTVVGKGQAVRIMTGAPIPVGADAILRVEATKRDEHDPSRVHAMMEVPPGEAVSLQGEDAPQGAVLLEAGLTIGAAETAVLAANGEAMVAVYRRPRVGIIVSGEEVRPLTGDLQPGQIRDSNGPMVAALVRDYGGQPVQYGQVGDDLQAITDLVKKAASECDLVLTTGGVSVGDYDCMREAYQLAGGTVHFWKVAIRPGTPVTYAGIGTTPVVGLSGNPAAAFVNVVLLVKPLLRKLCGDPHPEHRPVRAVLDSDYDARTIGLDRFLRTQLTVRDGQLVASVPSKGQKAAIMTSLVGVQGLVRIPAREEVRQGMSVEVYPLQDGAFRA